MNHETLRHRFLGEGESSLLRLHDAALVVAQLLSLAPLMAHAQASESIEVDSLLPLSEYLSLPDDARHPSYTFIRCAGVMYGVVIYGGDNLPEEEHQQISRTIEDTMFAAVVVGARTSAEQSDQSFADMAESELAELADQVKSQVVALAEFYSSRMELNYLQQGQAYAQDPLITGDLTICKEYYLLAQEISNKYL
jgi:hypothetical protein